MFDKVLAKTQWYELLKEEIKKPYFISIEDSILEDVNKQITIFPRGKDVFQALSLCAPADTKVVILGQDPYHGVGQANGLAFSVDYGVALPPSLGNIYKELQADIGCPIPPHGVLRHWAVQGVLLLNTALTVRAHQAASHSQIGWHTFTDAIINLLNERFSNIVFILWGAHAQSKAALIDTRKHCIISAPHPSPLSAYRGFLGSKPFSKANNYLTSCGKNSINWCIPEFPH